MVARSGKHSEREARSTASGYAGTGWWEFPDLAHYPNRKALAQLDRWIKCAIRVKTLSRGSRGLLVGLNNRLYLLDVC
jgi:hypothetical protein